MHPDELFSANFWPGIFFGLFSLAVMTDDDRTLAH
jgi:hypothetical protein